MLSVFCLCLLVGTAYADYPEHWVTGGFLPMPTTYNQNELVTLTVQFTPANGDMHPIVGHVRFTTIYYPDWEPYMPYPVNSFGDIGDVPLVDGKASITTSFSESGQKIIATGFYCDDGYYIDEDIPDVWREERIYINSTSIPEFQTVALPIVAMLGIMFLIGRKKK